MKKFVLATMFALVGSTAYAAMDNLTYMTEMNALSQAVALEAECEHAIDADKMMNFVTEKFEGRESDVLSGLSGHVSIAEYQLGEASALQKKLMCATAAKYIEKHNLAPSN